MEVEISPCGCGGGDCGRPHPIPPASTIKPFSWMNYLLLQLHLDPGNNLLLY